MKKVRLILDEVDYLELLEHLQKRSKTLLKKIENSIDDTLENVHKSKIEKSQKLIFNEVERLKENNEDITVYKVAKNLGMSRITVTKYIKDYI